MVVYWKKRTVEVGLYIHLRMPSKIEYGCNYFCRYPLGTLLPNTNGGDAMSIWIEGNTKNM